MPPSPSTETVKHCPPSCLFVNLTTLSCAGVSFGVFLFDRLLWGNEANVYANTFDCAQQASLQIRNCSAFRGIFPPQITLIFAKRATSYKYTSLPREDIFFLKWLLCWLILFAGVRRFILEIDIYRYRRKIKWKGGIRPSFFYGGQRPLFEEKQPVSLVLCGPNLCRNSAVQNRLPKRFLPAGPV